MRIYLIRHGETAWNRENRIQGRENVPLSPEGIAQAEECGRAFEDISLKAVASSPLSRAVDTARAIGRVAGVRVIISQGLIERDFGDISGKVVDIFNPEKYTTDLEPLDQVAHRMLDALKELSEELKGDFAAVSHGGSINALLKELTGGRIGSGKTRLKNACISVLESVDGTAFHVVDYNLTAEEFSDRAKRNFQEI